MYIFIQSFAFPEGQEFGLQRTTEQTRLVDVHVKRFQQLLQGNQQVKSADGRKPGAAKKGLPMIGRTSARSRSSQH